jgi:hypothetical protein
MMREEGNKTELLPDSIPLRDGRQSRDRKVGIKRPVNVGPVAQVRTPGGYGPENGGFFPEEEKRSRGGIIVPKTVDFPEPETPAKQETKLTWQDYCQWRETKCQPSALRAPIWLDEMDQAIHECVGEVAELSTVILGADSGLVSPEFLTKIRDEIGDVIFTASWVADTIDESILRGRGEIGRMIPDEQAAGFAASYMAVMKIPAQMISKLDDAPQEVQQNLIGWLHQCQDVLIEMSANAGMLSNRFKKIRWHRKGQNVDDQAKSVFFVLISLDALCALFNTSLAECARANMAKLDARYPNGWMLGGGIRETSNP